MKNTNNSLRGHLVIDDGVGDSWNVLLNLNALRMACEALDVDLGEFMKQFDKNAVSVLPALLFHGVRNYQILHREELIDDFDHFAALVGTMDFLEIVKSVGVALTLTSGNVKAATKAAKK